jgi:GNAT superfamily N-acetyltransferase
MDLTLHDATPDDAPTLLRFIRELAAYEREPDAVVASEDSLRAQLTATPPPFACVLAHLDGQPVGFALYFHNYSTWRGRPGLYLEDLYVTPAARGRGVGRALLQTLARRAVALGCARMEWSVLDWNTPAIDFYRALGAQPMTGWTTWRLTDGALAALGAPAD